MYDLGGQKFPGEEIEFETEREGFNTYLLQDGTRLKLKAVVSQIVRLEGPYNPQGDPIYLVSASNVIATDVPERLKLKGDE